MYHWLNANVQLTRLILTVNLQLSILTLRIQDALIVKGVYVLEGIRQRWHMPGVLSRVSVLKPFQAVMVHLQHLM